MKWRSARRSSNVEDRRGMGPGGGGGMKLGLGGIAIVVVIGLLLGKNPMEMLGLLAEVQQQAPAGTDQPGGATTAPVDDEASQFVASILGETEDVWGAIFQASGEQYPPAQLVLFTGSVNSACGGATAAVGPFYCPGDRKVYIDLSFFQQMRDRLGGGGDFAEAYVIAHEVGHHIQTLTGVSAKVNQVRQRGGNVEGAEGPLVRQELQADCYAGLWAHHAQQRHAWLEPGDLEEALNTATAIGDDTLQRQGQGQVVPDSFTHGSAQQRVRWFRIGFESGDYRKCDTFAAVQL
ncbi:KPN_02809 family neutral zinc metallopeptidase [Arenimonas daejeonensis]|uniref:KPN_02809 family neutral zinc metallopeptidase n=1 Tax=Arenimonas daejeonensis TaxID=370777 RepID=UPI0011BDD935|nr:neutral zinc metallopeptidase [Arenimonas daejeonensis]